MAFYTDKQTMDDLRLFARRGDDSVYSLFNRTATRIGGALLEEMFRYPLKDAAAINRRSSLLRYFSGITGGFPFRPELFDVAEQYLSATDERTRLSGERKGTRLAGLVGEDNAYKTLYRAITALGIILRDLHLFLLSVPASSPYYGEASEMLSLFAEETMQGLIKEGPKIPYDRVVVYDSYLRFRQRETVRRLLQSIYQLDVYFSVAATAMKRDFVFPIAAEGAARRIVLEGIYHPMVPGAVPNTLEITEENHILFLTGANMAGKSTFMKTIGIVLYLAHMGFPVPAARVELAVLDGIFSTINLPDDVGAGVSHFYAEVQRIRKVAQHLAQGRRLFVIFDELFRGTNVKDAFEATIALTKAFAHRKDSVLLLSTHIIEAGEVLAREVKEIAFLFLPTRMEGAKPVYTYRVERGITTDRHGMVILGNEGIFDILKSRKEADAVAGDEFIADQQTLDDLNLTGRYKPGSIFSLFNQVHTDGAQRLLEEMFRRPLHDADAINRRSSQFRYLQELDLKFPFTREQLRLVEEYLHNGRGGGRLAVTAAVLRMRVMEVAVKDERYQQLRVAVAGVRAFVRTAWIWIRQFSAGRESPIGELVEEARGILADARLAQERLGEVALTDNEDLSWRDAARWHYIYGTVLEAQLRRLCEIVYELDLGISVATVAKAQGFVYAQALPKKHYVFRAEGLWHPGVAGAVGNTINLGRDSNLIFLTGANMAGKSTLMKSFGIAVYLAHMGFPVAAKEMVFSTRDGVYSSINVPDDLNRGHSHFYAEALRVKAAARSISEGKQLVVIFDELFKGTNVKDAYDATLAVISAFSDYRDCFFVVSTHIIEVGDALRRDGRLQFLYLPTVMEGAVPRYTYRLQQGITVDRHGMRIIEQEGVLEMIGTE